MTSTRPVLISPRDWCFSCSTFVVDALARGAVAGTAKGQPMTSIFDRPLKARTFSGLGRRRRFANIVATVLVSLSMVIALAPLLWVLCSVIAKGFKAITSQRVVDAFTSGYDGIHGWGRRIPRDRRYPAAGIGVRRDLHPDRCHGRDLSGRVRRRHPTGQAGHLHGGHPQSGVPSIVAALFIYALCVATLGFPRSEFAVSLALVLLMLPVIVRATEEMLRIVPVDLREASYALGVPKWKTIARIVIPTGLSGIITGDHVGGGQGDG